MKVFRFRPTPFKKRLSHKNGLNSLPAEAETVRMFEGHAEVVLAGSAAPNKEALAKLERAVVYVHAKPPKHVVGARIVPFR